MLEGSIPVQEHHTPFRRILCYGDITVQTDSSLPSYVEFQASGTLIFSQRVLTRL